MNFQLSLLISPEAINSDAGNSSITAIDAWGPSLYIGTSNGRILHYFQPSPADQCIIASVQQSHKKKVRPVSRIVLLPSISRALILSHKTTSVFSLPEFAPCNNVASMRDVNDVFVQSSASKVSNSNVVEVTALLKSAIYVVNVQSDKLSAGKNVPYSGAIVGARQSDFVLVANSASYDLIDLHNSQRIPLFAFGSAEPSEATRQGSADAPSIAESASDDTDSLSRDDESIQSNKSKEQPQEQAPHSTGAALPIIVPVDVHEFLVTTLSGDTAIGLVVNSEGELSRGTIAWDSYPTSVAVDGSYVFSVVENSVLIHSLDTQELVQTIKFEERPLVTKLMSDRTFISTDVTDKLKLVAVTAPETSKAPESSNIEQSSLTRSSIVVYTPKGGVQCLCVESEFQKLEKLFDQDSEAALEQLEQSQSLRNGPVDCYFSTKAALQLLKSNTFLDALSIWLRPVISPRLLIYILDAGAQDEDDIYVPEPLYPLVVELRNKLSAQTKKSGEPLTEFYSSYLQICLQQSHEDDSSMTRCVRQALQLAYLRLALAVKLSTARIDEIVQQYAEDNMLARITKELETAGRLESLATVLRRQGRTEELFECWKSIITSDPQSKSAKIAVNSMTESLMTSSDKQVIWNYGLWLLSVHPASICIFTESTNETLFEPPEILAGLKSLPTDEPWKVYLKNLVYVKKDTVFAGDLAFCLLDELIADINVDRAIVDSITQTYNDYMAIPTPKPSYIDVFSKSPLVKPEIRTKRVEYSNFLTEKCELTVFDADQLIKTINESSISAALKYELAVLYGIQGHGDKCLSMLTDMTDYSAATKHCAKLAASRQKDDPLDPFPFLFERFMVIPNELDRLNCTKLLLDQWGPNIDIFCVLKLAPDSWPISVLEPYFGRVFRHLVAAERTSRLSRTLSRAEASYLSKEHRTLKALELKLDTN